MRMLRARILSVLLTVILGLGLASSALAHRMPSGAEQALQALQAAGLPLGALCGHAQDKPGCGDESCPICPGGAAVPGAAFAAPAPVLGLVRFAVPLPRGRRPVAQRRVLGHDARGPPV